LRVKELGDAPAPKLGLHELQFSQPEDQYAETQKEGDKEDEEPAIEHLMGL
jgi:hypothetical protein